MSHRFLRLSMLAVLSAMQAVSPTQMHGQQPGAPPSAGSGSTLEGQRIFAASCAPCHGLDARGSDRGPDIASKREVQQLSDDALLRLVQDGVAGTGMPAFRSLGATQVQTIVHYLRTLQGQTVAVVFPGDPERGKGLFFGKPGCSQCHMASGKGGFIASDLSSYTGPRSADEIRRAIADPDKSLDPGKRSLVVTTTTGQTLTGIARNEDNFSLQLQTLDGAFHLFAKSELRKIDYQPRSLMPGDYGARLSRQELDDLVSYLMSIVRTNVVRTNSNQPAGKE
jgi:cytochrome c oxidase cbb3-type subunit 3